MTIRGNRAEDKSFWVWFDYITTKYKLLIWVSISILASAGFGLRLPIQTANETKALINAKIDTVNNNLQTKIKAIEQQHETIKPQLEAVKDDLSIILRVECGDKFVSAHDKLMSGLNCRP
jgi:hypothetical protein